MNIAQIREPRAPWFRKHLLLPVYFVATVAALLLITSPSDAYEASYGYSPLHPLKYGEGFPHFGYVNAAAPKGGTLRLGAIDTFDSLNTLRYPGRAPTARPERFDIRDLIYDTLLVKSADEPAGYYGLLAKTVEVADDYGQVRFTLRDDARWHDGKPVTARDIAFTFKTLARQGPPYQRQVLRGVEVEVEDEATVLFKAPRPGDRDFAGRVGTIAIHPEHFWKEKDVTTGGMDVPLGSGPYRVAKVDAGHTIVFEREPDYWAAAHPVNIGRHNFDRIHVAFYRNNTVALEAFKAGNYDLRVEQDAVRWATGYEGPALRAGRIVKERFDGSAPGQLMSLVFNLRRPAFRDVKVRRAIALAYDFDWTNENLFHGQYQRVQSFFGDTRNAASGPAGKGERAILADYASSLPDEIFKSASPGNGKLSGDRRTALVEAARLLDEAGFKMRDSARIDPATGERFSIRLVYLNPRLGRVFGAFAKGLGTLGIELRYPNLEPVSASKSILAHDFDMAALERWTPGLVPGTSENLIWGSALADRTPSYALSGAKDDALDAAIGAMGAARTLASLETAARAFDRVLRWRQYAIPLWRAPEIWIAHSKSVTLPSYDGLDLLSVIDLAWQEDARRAEQN